MIGFLCSPAASYFIGQVIQVNGSIVKRRVGQKGARIRFEACRCGNIAASLRAAGIKACPVGYWRLRIAMLRRSMIRARFRRNP